MSAIADQGSSAVRSTPPRRNSSTLFRILLGPQRRPRWERPGLLALLSVTALLYGWGLDINGWANAYYSAAVMSGAQDWIAFLFGSSDAGNSISVDKPPMSLWIMSLSVRVFGLNSWSVLLPQAAMGVASVFLLFRMVRRHTDAATGLLAGALFAVTPVAAVMFRYNNPDALLTLLMIGVAQATLTSVNSAKVRWLVLAGALSGAAFLTKQLQIGLLLPAVCIVYLTFAQVNLLRRLVHLSLAGLTAILTGGWWFLLVQMTNPSQRPYVGGTRMNNVLELTVGYNGLDRLTGAGASRTLALDSSEPRNALDGGFLRFLQPDFTGQIGWFMPLAVAGLVFATCLIWRKKGSSSKRAFMTLNIFWFLSSTTVLAYMSGIVHPYYSLTAVPSLCCLAAFGLMHFLRSGGRNRPQVLFAITLLATSVLGFASATRSIVDFPWLSSVILTLGAISVALLLVPNSMRVITTITTISVMATLLLGPIIWTMNTVLSPHVGAGVVAGPSILGIRTDDPTRRQVSPNVPPSLVAVVFGDIPVPDVVKKLKVTPESATWVGAMVGSETAANYQLEIGRPVMPIGGFDGTDPSPTLEHVQALIKGKELTSLTIQTLPPLAAEGHGESARIVEWIRASFPRQVIGGAEYYDLTLGP